MFMLASTACEMRCRYRCGVIDAANMPSGTQFAPRQKMGRSLISMVKRDPRGSGSVFKRTVRKPIWPDHSASAGMILDFGFWILDWAAVGRIWDPNSPFLRGGMIRT